MVIAYKNTAEEIETRNVTRRGVRAVSLEHVAVSQGEGLVLTRSYFSLVKEYPALRLGSDSRSKGWEAIPGRSKGVCVCAEEASPPAYSYERQPFLFAVTTGVVTAIVLFWPNKPNPAITITGKANKTYHN
jgi:hypothetical protein